MASIEESKTVVIEPKKSSDIESSKERVRNYEFETIVDGRIFEADRDIAVSAEEKVEIEEFNKQVKRYNVLSRQQLRDAIKQEHDELQSKKGASSSYLDESKEERVKNLEDIQKLLEDMEKNSSVKK